MDGDRTEQQERKEKKEAGRERERDHAPALYKL